MDPIELLTEDHRIVKKLLADGEQLGTAKPAMRRDIFETIKREMMVHEQIEEEIFYKELRGHPKAKDIVLEGIEEHNVVDTIMNDLEITEPDDEYWPAKFKVMKENIEHHIGEEEETMFPTARKVFDADELEALGARMEKMQRRAKSALQA